MCNIKLIGVCLCGFFFKIFIMINFMYVCVLILEKLNRNVFVLLFIYIDVIGYEKS